jgi:hypothetical protein
LFLTVSRFLRDPFRTFTESKVGPPVLYFAIEFVDPDSYLDINS